MRYYHSRYYSVRATLTARQACFLHRGPGALHRGEGGARNAHCDDTPFLAKFQFAQKLKFAPRSQQLYRARMPTPCDFSQAPSSETAIRIEQLVQKLSSSYASALNGWLDRCIEAHCPKAHELVRMQRPGEACEVLRAEGFCWTRERLEGDEIATFWQGGTPLSSCRLDIKFLLRASENAGGAP